MKLIVCSGSHAGLGFHVPSPMCLPPSCSADFFNYASYNPQVQRFQPYCVIPPTHSEKSETDSSGRRRKSRTVFSEYQLMGLEKKFQTQKYLSVPDRVEIAGGLNLSETQVKTW